MIADYLSGISTLTLVIHLLDILLVWFLVYKLLTLLKGTRGMQLVKGILIIIFQLYWFYNDDLHIRSSSYLGSVGNYDYIPTRIKTCFGIYR